MLSQNKNNLNADGARKIFKSLGVPPSFLDKAYSMAAPFAGFIPGVNSQQIQSALNDIKNGMEETPKLTKNNNIIFDKNKYPKV